MFAPPETLTTLLHSLCHGSGEYGLLQCPSFSFWFGLANWSPSKSWREGRERGQVFISLHPPWGVSMGWVLSFTKGCDFHQVLPPQDSICPFGSANCYLPTHSGLGWWRCPIVTSCRYCTVSCALLDPIHLFRKSHFIKLSTDRLIWVCSTLPDVILTDSRHTSCMYVTPTCLCNDSEFASHHKSLHTNEHV